MNVEELLQTTSSLQVADKSVIILSSASNVDKIYINHSKVKKLQLSGFHSQYTHSRKTSFMYMPCEYPIELLAREQN